MKRFFALVLVLSLILSTFPNPTSVSALGEEFAPLPDNGKWIDSAYYETDGVHFIDNSAMPDIAYDKALPMTSTEFSMRIDRASTDWLSVSFMDAPVFNPGNPAAASGLISLMFIGTDGSLSVNSYLYKNGQQSLAGQIVISNAGIVSGSIITVGMRKLGEGFKLSVNGVDLEYDGHDLTNIFTNNKGYVVIGKNNSEAYSGTHVTVTSLNATSMPDIKELPGNGSWTGAANYTKNGIQCVSTASLNAIAYNKAASMNYFTMDISIDKLPTDWLAVSFMDAPVFNPGNPAAASGLISLIFIGADGSLTVNSYLYKDGQQAYAGQILIPNAGFGASDTITIGMRRYGNGYKFSVNGVDLGYQGIELAAVYTNGLAYPVFGYCDSTGTALPRFTLTKVNKASQPQLDTLPVNGGWIGYAQNSHDGVQYVNADGPGAIAYNKALSMNYFTMEVKLDKLPSNWLAVSFMDAPVFNPGNPAAASGLISLIFIGTDGSLTVNSYLYKDGQEAFVGQILIPDAAVSLGDILRVGMRRFGSGFVLSVNGKDTSYNGVDLAGLYTNNEAYAVIGIDTAAGEDTSWFTVPYIMEESTAVAYIPGVDPGDEPENPESCPGNGVWMGSGAKVMDAGVQLLNSDIGIGSLVYSKPVTTADTSVRLRLDWVPGTGDWLAVSFMDNAVFNAGNPSAASGIIATLAVNEKGALTVTAYCYKNSTETVVGQINIGQADIKENSAVAIRLRFEGDNYIFSVNGLDMIADLSALKEIYKNQKAYIAVGENASSELLSSRFTIRHLTGLHPDPGPEAGADPGIEPSNPEPCPGNGTWKGSTFESVQNGIQLIKNADGISSIVYNKPLSIADNSIRIKLDKLPGAGEWTAVSYMTKAVFNAGDPSAASGIIVLLKVNENGGLTATAYVYKNGQEVSGGQLILPFAGLKDGSTVKIDLQITNDSASLIVNGQMLSLDIQLVKDIYANGWAFPGVGASCLTDNKDAIFTIRHMTGLYSENWQTGDEDPVIDRGFSSLPSNGFWVGSLKTDNNGVHYINGLAGMDALIYDQAVAMDFAAVEIRIDQDPSKTEWFCVNFMDKAVFNPGNPSLASGLFSLFSVGKDGSLTVNSFLYSSGKETFIGKLVLADANIKAGSRITVALRKTQNGYALFINGNRCDADLKQLKNIFKTGKGYIITGLNSKVAISDSRFTITNFNGVVPRGKKGIVSSNIDLKEVVETEMISPPEDGEWVGLVKYSDEGAGYINSRGGMDGIIYNKPLSMTHTTLNIKIGKIPEENEWYCVNFMEMPVFNPGDPSAASGIVTLLYFDKNGGITANTFVYKNGKETFAGQLVLMDAGIKSGDTIAFTIKGTTDGYALFINGERIPAELSDLNAVFVDQKGYPVIGAFTNIGYSHERFIITNLNGIKPVSLKNDEDSSLSSSSSSSSENSSDTSDNGEENSSQSLLLIILAVIAGVIILGGTAGILIRKKRTIK